MATDQTQTQQKTTPEDVRLSWLEVAGFKSHVSAHRIDFRGLTLFCGANSSGKSSVLQPLLLLKQTIDALPADSGALKLGGENVSYSSPAQFLSFGVNKKKAVTEFTLGIGLGAQNAIIAKYASEDDEIDVVTTTYRKGGGTLELNRGNPLPIQAVVQADLLAVPSSTLAKWARDLPARAGKVPDAIVVRSGPFLVPDIGVGTLVPVTSISHLRWQLSRLMHLSGHRGNPLRQYPVFAAGGTQPGLFHPRAAAIVAAWARIGDPRLDKLSDAMSSLGLTWKVVAKKIDATTVEVQVGRTAAPQQGGAQDLVSIADVGFGVSQTLPVVVALVAAERDQIVYIEQPEIHLHPRAQKAMADLIASAVNRGARVIVETHSEIILTRIQYLIANDNLPASDVVAHWFVRDAKTGESKVTRAQPAADGSLGDWPADFADVGAEVDREYADAAFDRLSEGGEEQP